MKKLRLFLICIMLVSMPILVLAQDDTSVKGFDPEVLIALLAAGILGIPIDKVIKWVKDALRLTGFITYVFEVIICAIPVAIYQAAAGWIWGDLIMYTFFVFLSVHGWYVVKK